MVAIVLQVLGCASIVAGTLILGARLRREPSRAAAERLTRMMHFLFFAGFAFPGVFSVFYPGLPRLDGILGIPSLPLRPVALALGILLIAAGLYLGAASNWALGAIGKGAAAFRLTRGVVEGSIYRRTRNPMSLGFYMICVGVGLAVGSTYVTVGSLVGIIPAHVLFLKYFEERELQLRFGEEYMAYKRSVSFLLPRLGAHSSDSEPNGARRANGSG